MRLGIFVPLMAATLAAPATAADVFLQFTVQASGTRVEFFPCTQGGAASTCPAVTTITPAFYYSQVFSFQNGISNYQSGHPNIPQGEVTFTLRDVGKPFFRVENFAFSRGTRGPFPFGIPAGTFSENASAPSFIISSIPEPATWTMMMLGCWAVGYALRRHREDLNRIPAHPAVA